MATKKFSPAQIAAQKLFAERARAGTLGKGKRKAAVKRKANPVTETLIYGLAPGETRDYMEELMYAGGQKLTQAQIDKVFKAASDAGYHSFRVAGFDPTMKPDFAAAVRRKRNPITKMKIERSETPDNPEGIVVTEAGALRFARQNMPSDLKKAGFVASVFPGARGWVINYGKAVKRNPDKAKPRAYVKRASHATGAPPSKRLVTRRKKALTAPAGYFPNPGKRTYEVFCQTPSMKVNSWTKVASFFSAEKAKQYAKAYAKSYPSHYVRVESHG